MSMSQPDEVLRVKSRFHPAAVYRSGDVVVRDSAQWTPTVHALLRHLERVGFDGAPRVAGSGFDPVGRETLTFIQGNFIHPGPWTLEGATSVGVLLRRLHAATASFQIPTDAVWYPWFGRGVGRGANVIGHCDVAPWNIVARDGRAAAFIDWDRAGPVDPLTELAQACWLNAKLHDDVVAVREGLPSVDERARHLRAIVDGYGLSVADRRSFVDRIVEFTVHDAAGEADLAHITADTPADQLDPRVPWAVAWRTRAAAWQLRKREVLERALA
ncbi:MAG: aminoglycoside phosphotransferase family protein [Chloroflexota bacterium]|nr:aminoglycoside phosphotransferase family protein [Chloroflexota bacterium]